MEAAMAEPDHRLVYGFYGHFPFRFYDIPVYIAPLVFTLLVYDLESSKS